MKHHRDYEWIRPLQRAANDFLEVLVPRFKIQRHPGNDGFSLNLKFGPKSQAIWHRRGKDEVRDKLMSGFRKRSRKHGEELESFFFGNGGDEFHFDDPAFPFRFCSGGALPIITMAGRQYYRLHWRDIHPVGWNITNGGSDSIAEMLDPARIIQRELCEELVVFDFESVPPRRLVLGEPGSSSEVFPSQAWRLWQSRLEARGMNLAAIGNEPLPCGWLRGPDDLTVSYRGAGPNDHLPHRSDGLFLNINAEDFGIEVDQAVRIDLPESAVICDGELLSDCLLDSPIGLFEVEALHKALQSGSREFRPSVLFFNAQRYNPADLEDVLQSFLEGKRRNGLLPDVEQRQLREAEAEGRQFDLCPASRSIIRRCMKLVGRAETPATGEIDVFISFASEDQDLAQEIHDWLAASGRHPVFFSPESIRESDYTNAILSALDQSRNLVVVGSKIDHLHKNWVNYEYTSFLRRMLNEPKSKRQIFTVLSDMPSEARPPAPLSDFQIYFCTRNSLADSLACLLGSFR